jgi:hypothetical protein
MYRVYSERELIAQISAVYLRADAQTQNGILLGVESIDAALSKDPMAAGESHESDAQRVVIEGPVAVSFRVDLDRQLVRVASVSISERDR